MMEEVDSKTKQKDKGNGKINVWVERTHRNKERVKGKIDFLKIKKFYMIFSGKISSLTKKKKETVSKVVIWQGRGKTQKNKEYSKMEKREI